MIFDFDDEKNERLISIRNISFEQVIDVIDKKGVILDFLNPNQKKYPDQRIMVVEIHSYTYCIPYEINDEVIFLKTIYPNRKFLYLLD